MTRARVRPDDPFRSAEGCEFVIPPCPDDEPRSGAIIVWLVVMLLFYVIGFCGAVLWSVAA